MADYIELAELCMEAFGGAPEEFGGLLYDATMTIDHYNMSDWHTQLRIKREARKRILSLPHGRELLSAELHLHTRF